MSDKLEEIKQVAKEFYDKQRHLMRLMMELADEEFKEFNPWFNSITNENLKRKYEDIYPQWAKLYKI